MLWTVSPHQENHVIVGHGTMLMVLALARQRRTKYRRQSPAARAWGFVLGSPFQVMLMRFFQLPVGDFVTRLQQA